MVCYSIWRVAGLLVPQFIGLSTAWALFHGPVIVCSHALPRMPPPRVRSLPVFLDLASLLQGNLQKLETIEQPEFVPDFYLHWPACYRIKLRYLANEEESVNHCRDSAFADFDADPGHDRTTWTTDGDRLAVVVTNGGATLSLELYPPVICGPLSVRIGGVQIFLSARDGTERLKQVNVGLFARAAISRAFSTASRHAPWSLHPSESHRATAA